MNIDDTFEVDQPVMVVVVVVVVCSELTWPQLAEFFAVSESSTRTQYVIRDDIKITKKYYFILGCTVLCFLHWATGLTAERPFNSMM